MAKLLRAGWTITLQGLLVLLPLYLVVLVLVMTVVELAALLVPIAEAMPLQVASGPIEAMVLAVLVLAGVCFGVGLSLHTRAGRATGALVRRTLLDRVPGYNLIRSFTIRMAGAEEAAKSAFMMPALVALQPGVQVLGFVMEQHASGIHAVFVPLSPTPSIGTVYYVPADRVQPVEAKGLDVAGVLSHWGLGSGALLAGGAAASEAGEARS